MQSCGERCEGAVVYLVYVVVAAVVVVVAVIAHGVVGSGPIIVRHAFAMEGQELGKSSDLVTVDVHFICHGVCAVYQGPKKD